MPDMKSELQKVVAEKPSLRKRLIERVWVWLKDHPEKTARHIADSLNEDHQAVSSRLHELKIRGMVTQRLGRDRLLEWSVVNTANGVYALSPKLKKPKKTLVTAEKSTPVGVKRLGKPDFIGVFQLTKTVEEEAEHQVKQMPVELAHAMYLKLKTYFDPKVL